MCRQTARLLSMLLLLPLLLSACGGTAKTVQAADVLAAFKAAGLEAEQAHAMTKADYGMAPMLCQDGAQRFLIPSLGTSTGGRVFVCSSPSDRDALKAFYDKLAQASALFFSWTFVRGQVLVQINGDLPEAQARKYEAALNSMP